MFSTSYLLTKENLFKKIDSYNIFRGYSNNFKEINKKFSSDFREDPVPSAIISYVKGDLLYTDFGEGSYRCIDFVMRKFGIDFRDALEKINADFNLGLYGSKKNTIFTPKKMMYKAPMFKEKSSTIIKIKSRPFDTKDLAYWYKYGWTKNMLIKANIKAIDYYWLTMESKGIKDKTYSALNDLAYSYDFYWNKDIFRRKIYFPEKDQRFISNVDDTIIQGWPELPKNGDILFVTSSMKDRGPFVWLKYPVLAPNNEGVFLPEKVFYCKIKPRFKRIILFYDNDATGIKNALKFAKKYQIEARWNPMRAPKDPSDFVASFNNTDTGIREFNNYLKTFL